MTATSGMNIAQRILHVGGRNNAAGYIEFGSIQAVEALVRQVLRDLPPADIPLLSDDEIYEMYSEPRSDAEMLEFGREVEAAVRKLLIATPQPAPVQEPVKVGCLRCNTPKKCDVWGCSPNTFPSEQPAPPADVPMLTDEELREAFAQNLSDTYVCSRVWSAWSYGTMSEDDFSPASECDELLDSLVQAVRQKAGLK